jgi:sarcosine oxidase subunit beta
VSATIRFLDELPRSASLVIVGGGVIGAATAWHAARAGLDPVLIEMRPALCTLTTPASTGAYRLQFDNLEELKLVRESVELFENFADVTGQSDFDLGIRPQGYLWCTTDEARVDRQRELVAQQHSWGQTDIELLDGDEARANFPYIAPEVLQARWRARDGFLDPKALTMGLVAASKAGVVLNCEVTGFELAGERVTGLTTGSGAIDTDAVVVCCGPFSARLAERVGVHLPVELIARQKIVLPEIARVPPEAPMTIDEDTGTHWRPALSSGAYLIYTDPTTPPSEAAEQVPVDVPGVFKVLDPASPVAAARVSPFWTDVWDRGASNWLVDTGQYTMSPDHRPLIGSTPVGGLYVNTGDSGHGVMSSPAVSRRVIELLTGAMAPEDNPFRIDRSFAERVRDVL